ncbi:dihydroneopterin aldolase [Sphingobacterium suaedae]|uniref:Dihydroneopterin aldolase n=1 Tax=Sphingobacterium suaedae TaxID=1686402 RepID=A0ABW5KB24_9SPHI
MSQITQEVALTNVRFYAPIGYYAEERLLGNEFFVDVAVRFPFQNPDAEQLSNTINYEGLFAILSRVMKRERLLLESAAEEILSVARDCYSFAVEIDVMIRKTTPPFGKDHAHSSVKLHYRKQL